MAHKLSKRKIQPLSLKVFVFLALLITWHEQILNEIFILGWQDLQGGRSGKAVLLTPRDNRWNATPIAFG